jgi:multidrug efflux system membrane fusion protein
MIAFHRSAFCKTKLRASLRLSPSRLFAAMAALLLLAACSTEAEKEKPSPAAPVTAGVAVTKNVPVAIRAIGTVEPYNSVSVRAQVAGEITGIYFQQGQEVAQGDLLFTIDPRPYQAALEAVLADLARDEATLKSAEEDVLRYRELIKKDYVTSQQYDQVVANADALKATVEADEAAVKNARINLDYCTVRAPISGRTGNVLVQLGNVIKADDLPVVTINQITPVYVSFSVPEKYLSDIQRHFAKGALAVEATFPDKGASSFRGRLSFINNTVDSSTGTILMKATFRNNEKALWPGQFVNVTLALAVSENAVVVPSQAVQRGQQGDYVFVIKPDMTVELRSVQTGQQVDEDTVIRKGLDANEKVVTDGQLRLFPGARVEITNTHEASGQGKA